MSIFSTDHCSALNCFNEIYLCNGFVKRVANQDSHGPAHGLIHAPAYLAIV
jgi:hypothetical protein